MEAVLHCRVLGRDAAPSAYALNVIGLGGRSTLDCGELKQSELLVCVTRGAGEQLPGTESVLVDMHGWVLGVCAIINPAVMQQGDGLMRGLKLL